MSIVSPELGRNWGGCPRNWGIGPELGPSELGPSELGYGIGELGIVVSRNCGVPGIVSFELCLFGKVEDK